MQVDHELLKKQRIGDLNNTGNPYLNTPLHIAILLSDVTDALKIIEHTPGNSRSIFNVLAAGNTPFVLALKTGNIKIAEKLLEYSEVDVNIPDNMGMKAIHWASFLRVNLIIRLLLKRNLEVFIAEKDILNPLTAKPYDKETYSERSFLYQIKASDFYEQEWVDKSLLNDVKMINENSKLIVPWNTVSELYKAREKGQLQPHFFKEDLSLKAVKFIRMTLIHIPLHTVAFHMDALCLNYLKKSPIFTYDSKQYLTFLPSYLLMGGGMSINDPSIAPTVQLFHYKFPYGSKGGKCTSEIFDYNFSQGYSMLRDERNKLPVEKDIFDELTQIEKIQHQGNGCSITHASTP